MIKYFYYLYFQYEIEKDENNTPITSTFHFGYFSSLKKVKEVIDKYRHLQGFNEHTIDKFLYKKHAIKFNKTLQINKEKISIYGIFHEYSEDGYDYWSIFGPYETKLEAKKVISNLKKEPPFANHLEGFELLKYKVDSQNLAWAEGYNKWWDD